MLNSGHYKISTTFIFFSTFMIFSRGTSKNQYIYEIYINWNIFTKLFHHLGDFEEEGRGEGEGEVVDGLILFNLP